MIAAVVASSCTTPPVAQPVALASEGCSPASERSLPSTQTKLDVPGFQPAVLWLPDPRVAPRPVLMIAHGAGGNPDAPCRWWQSALAGRALLLCLAGTPVNRRDPDTGYFFEHHHALEKEALAALDALRREHQSAIAPGPVVYVGFSQGAIMGALFTAQHPELFRRLLLIEGGYDEWDVATARRFAGAGNARVLFVCGVSHCTRHARRSLGWLRRGGVEARLEHAPGAGHTYEGEVGERVRAAFSWLVAGDDRWR